VMIGGGTSMTSGSSITGGCCIGLWQTPPPHDIRLLLDGRHLMHRHQRRLGSKTSFANALMIHHVPCSCQWIHDGHVCL
jgi:hypothetical protein